MPARSWARIPFSRLLPGGRADRRPLSISELRDAVWELRELDLAYEYFQEPLYQERTEQALAFRIDCLDVRQEEYPIAYRELVRAGIKAVTWRDPITEDAVVFVLGDLEPQERRVAVLRQVAGHIAPGHPILPSRLLDPRQDPDERAWNLLDDGRLWRENRAWREAPLWFPKRRLVRCGKPPRDPEQCAAIAARRAALVGIAGHYGPRLRLDSADLRFLGLTAPTRERAATVSSGGPRS